MALPSPGWLELGRGHRIAPGCRSPLPLTHLHLRGDLGGSQRTSLAWTTGSPVPGPGDVTGSATVGSGPRGLETRIGLFLPEHCLERQERLVTLGRWPIPKRVPEGPGGESPCRCAPPAGRAGVRGLGLRHRVVLLSEVPVPCSRVLHVDFRPGTGREQGGAQPLRELSREIKSWNTCVIKCPNPCSFLPFRLSACFSSSPPSLFLPSLSLPVSFLLLSPPSFLPFRFSFLWRY